MLLLGTNCNYYYSRFDSSTCILVKIAISKCNFRATCNNVATPFHFFFSLYSRMFVLFLVLKNRNLVEIWEGIMGSQCNISWSCDCLAVQQSSNMQVFFSGNFIHPRSGSDESIMSDVKRGHCWFCRDRGDKVPCFKCKVGVYCSEACLVRDMRRHMSECQSFGPQKCSYCKKQLENRLEVSSDL